MKSIWIIGVIIAVIIIGSIIGYLILNNPDMMNPATDKEINTNTGGSFNNDENSGTNTETDTPKTYEVNIQDFAYSPLTLTIKVGDRVIWTNQDSVRHTVTSDSGNELDSSLLSKGQTYSHTFNSAGTFDYHCIPHPYMKARIIVE